MSLRDRENLMKDLVSSSCVMGGDLSSKGKTKSVVRPLTEEGEGKDGR